MKIKHFLATLRVASALSSGAGAALGWHFFANRKDRGTALIVGAATVVAVWGVISPRHQKRLDWTLGIFGSVLAIASAVMFTLSGQIVGIAGAVFFGLGSIYLIRRARSKDANYL